MRCFAVARYRLWTICCILLVGTGLSAQESSSANLPSAPTVHTTTAGTDDLPLELQPHSSPTVVNSPKHVTTDMTHIVVSPVYIRTRDLAWLVPLAGGTAAAFATDT